jgi:hypothetical protein
MVLFNFHVKIEKSRGDREEGFGVLQFAAKVGEQEGGEKKAQASFGEKVKRAAVLIQEFGADFASSVFPGRAALRRRVRSPGGCRVDSRRQDRRCVRRRRRSAGRRVHWRSCENPAAILRFFRLQLQRSFVRRMHSGLAVTRGPQ